MPLPNRTITVRRWTYPTPPSATSINRLMADEGMRPFTWQNNSNRMFNVRSHGYDKVLWVVSGTLELIAPDENRVYVLRSGDRADIPAGVRHGIKVSQAGVTCYEASQSGKLARR